MLFEDDEFLPRAQDALCIFHGHVEGLPAAYAIEAGLDACLHYLADPPTVSPDVQKLRPRLTLMRFQRTLEAAAASQRRQ